MDTVRTQLETLSENAQGKVNYISWRFKLDLTLKSKDLYAVAIGTDTKPSGADTDAAVKLWTKKDLECQVLVGLNVSSEISKKIVNCKSAYKMLEKLEMLYGKKSDLTIEGLQRRFFSYKYDNGKSAVENCLAIMQLAEELSAEGEEVKENWVQTRILGMLPPKLCHFRTAWDNVSSCDKNLTTLIDRLRLEEDRLHETDKSKGHNAFFTKQSGNKNGKPKQQENSSNLCFKCGQPGHFKKDCKNKPCAKYIEYCKNNYSCNICHEKGHFAKECSKRPNDKNSNDKSDKNNSDKSKRRAFITIGLTTAEINNRNAKNESYNSWYQDCGATQHMTFRKDWLINFTEFEEPTKILIGNSTQIEGIGAGDVEMEAFNGTEWYPVVLTDVLFVPNLSFNLFSVAQMLDKGFIQCANAEQSVYKLADGNETVAIAEREDKLYTMLFRNEKVNKCLMTTSIKAWHEKLAHQNIKYVRDILKKSGVKYIDDWNDYVCPGCVYGKQHRVSHPRNEKVSTSTLELIHVDLCEMNIPSLGGAKYFLLLKDDFSHFRTVYFLKHKDEAASKLDIFMKMVENQFGRKVKCLRSDNGKEVINSNVKNLLEELGVFHSKSNAYTPQQNGRIEREMRTVVEAARSVIHAKDLDENLWAEAINYSVFTINQTGTSSVKGMSPADLWFGRQVKLQSLKCFGCECYVYIQDHKRGKTEKKSRKGILVGYDLDSPSYRIYLKEEDDIVSSENVVFDENPENQRSSIEFQMTDENEEKDLERNHDTSSSETASQSSEYVDISDDSDSSGVLIQQESTRSNLRNRRNLKRPARLDDYITENDERNMDTAMIGEVQDIPITEALKDEKWVQTITEEFESLMQMKTWDLVKMPSHITPLTCRWVLREKQDGRLKARLVVRGFEQEKGIDYSETFSPVARHVSIRLILSLAASNRMKLITFDVKTAFLHGDLREEIYMYQPEGFNDKTGRVCKLNKSLYGLKQAPKNWNDKFSTFLQTLNFESTDDDPCIYYNQNKSIIIALFVDDGLVVGKDVQEMLKVLSKMSKKFEITFDDSLKDKISYLGMEIKANRNGIFVSQPKYTESILERFKFDTVNSAYTPMERGMLTDEKNYENDKPLSKDKPYREVIGSLLYLATISRPDISFVVNYLSRFNNNPMESSWKMVKRVFAYLKGTVNYGIWFNGDTELIAYTDSDYGGDALTGHSTSGVLVMRGGPIVWYAQKQRLVATSTAEAEYRAAVSAIDDVCWIRRIGKELEIFTSDKPTTLCVDNQSAIHMLKNSYDGKITKGKKHIEIPRKFIKEHVDKTVRLQHVRSSDQLADILTKALSRKTFEDLRSKIIKEEC